MAIVYQIFNNTTGACYIGSSTGMPFGRWADIQADPELSALFVVDDNVPCDDKVTREPLFKPDPKPNMWYLMYGTTTKLEDGTVWENWTKARSWLRPTKTGLISYTKLPEFYRRRSAAEKMANRIMASEHTKRVKVVDGWVSPELHAGRRPKRRSILQNESI